jgi:hypothetical protein
VLEDMAVRALQGANHHRTPLVPIAFEEALSSISLDYRR